MTDLDLKQEASELKLRAPLPSTRHPGAVYLVGIGEGSRSTRRHALDEIASLLTYGECDALTLDWSKLRYQHTAAVRSALYFSLHAIDHQEDALCLKTSLDNGFERSNVCRLSVEL